MLEFFRANQGLISVLLSMAMLVVWVVYLQILLVQVRASRRSSILITRAAGRGMRSRCLVTNMSSQSLYVTSLIGILHAGDKQIEIALTDLRELPEDLGADPRSTMRQGSLSTGQYLDIGHFDDILEVMLRDDEAAGLEREDVAQLDLIVVAFYAPESLPVGARRSFQFRWESPSGTRVQPSSLRTEQIRGRRQRKRLFQAVERHM
ncbi:hypothetical protein [Erythrobacter sp. A6_0]|uniref:hypothetical protein n=1 Tax=Erythrobacter sp. A6_0 TaxID=2821089 RepID=UPI001ADC4A96|nr:hypothetical protein [Erythrobacter sp. A6_0]MBO9511643.1 hypothetical protein [Erythrobacter sp. A6_0]